MSTAVKSNPKLWELSKEMACKEGGLCKHSARKMQWAVRYYKKKGGGYKGGKKDDTSLSLWSKQNWGTSSGKKSEGKRRYLPNQTWKMMTPDQVRRANATKKRGHSKGKQFVGLPPDVKVLRKITSLVDFILNKVEDVEDIEDKKKKARIKRIVNSIIKQVKEYQR